MERKDLEKYKIPDGPGIYLFKRGKRILYIGKAASLRDRIRSYFSGDLGDARSPAIVGMVKSTSSVLWKTTETVLEALILEANLIKKHQPSYNVDQKDNKSFNYLVITKEKFPCVLVRRGREIFVNNNVGFRKPYIIRSGDVFGPFTQGESLKEALKLIRKIFPFRDTCIPQSGKPCFNRQIGLCPGVCSGEASSEQYARTIRNIKDLFSGRFRGLKRRLTAEMKLAAKREDFELAEKLRRQVRALTHILDVSLIRDEYRASSGGSFGGSFRIEAYDVAHTAGAETVGVMTVVSEGQAQKSEYRVFKVRGVQNDDTGALKEILERRLAHTEWHMPRLIVVDGGKAQVRAAKSVLTKAGVLIPIVGIVKNEFHKPANILGEERSIRTNEQDILLANAEAHRFAIKFHRRRFRKTLH